jgi:hypothetical protein
VRHVDDAMLKLRHRPRQNFRQRPGFGEIESLKLATEGFAIKVGNN